MVAAAELLLRASWGAAPRTQHVRAVDRWTFGRADVGTLALPDDLSDRRTRGQLRCDVSEARCASCRGFRSDLGRDGVVAGLAVAESGTSAAATCLQHDESARDSSCNQCDSELRSWHQLASALWRRRRRRPHGGAAEFPALWNSRYSLGHALAGGTAAN